MVSTPSLARGACAAAAPRPPSCHHSAERGQHGGPRSWCSDFSLAVTACAQFGGVLEHLIVALKSGGFGDALPASEAKELGADALRAASAAKSLKVRLADARERLRSQTAPVISASWLGHGFAPVAGDDLGACSSNFGVDLLMAAKGTENLSTGVAALGQSGTQLTAADATLHGLLPDTSEVCRILEQLDTVNGTILKFDEIILKRESALMLGSASTPSECEPSAMVSDRLSVVATGGCSMATSPAVTASQQPTGEQMNMSHEPRTPPVTLPAHPTALVVVPGRVLAGKMHLGVPTRKCWEHHGGRGTTAVVRIGDACDTGHIASLLCSPSDAPMVPRMQSPCTEPLHAELSMGGAQEDDVAALRPQAFPPLPPPPKDGQTDFEQKATKDAEEKASKHAATDDNGHADLKAQKEVEEKARQDAKNRARKYGEKKTIEDLEVDAKMEAEGNVLPHDDEELHSACKLAPGNRMSQKLTTATLLKTKSLDEPYRLTINTGAEDLCMMGRPVKHDCYDAIETFSQDEVGGVPEAPRQGATAPCARGGLSRLLCSTSSGSPKVGAEAEAGVVAPSTGRAAVTTKAIAAALGAAPIEAYEAQARSAEPPAAQHPPQRPLQPQQSVAGRAPTKFVEALLHGRVDLREGGSPKTFQEEQATVTPAPLPPLPSSPPPSPRVTLGLARRLPASPQHQAGCGSAPVQVLFTGFHGSDLDRLRWSVSRLGGVTVCDLPAPQASDAGPEAAACTAAAAAAVRIVCSCNTGPGGQRFATIRTLKYLDGLLTGAWVLSADWVRASTLAHRWLPEVGFEVVGDVVHQSGACGRAWQWQGSKRRRLVNAIVGPCGPEGAAAPIEAAGPLFTGLRMHFPPVEETAVGACNPSVAFASARGRSRVLLDEEGVGPRPADLERLARRGGADVLTAVVPLPHSEVDPPHLSVYTRSAEKGLRSSPCSVAAATTPRPEEASDTTASKVTSRNLFRRTTMAAGGGRTVAVADGIQSLQEVIVLSEPPRIPWWRKPIVVSSGFSKAPRDAASKGWLVVPSSWMIDCISHGEILAPP